MGRFRKWLLRGALALVLLAIAAFFLIPAWHGYRPRGLVNDALLEAAPLRQKVADSYEKHQRLPNASEAPAFKAASSELRSAQSIAWDVADRAIVITLRDVQPGKRVALRAQERGGVLEWNCSTIDLDGKYLPAWCR